MTAIMHALSRRSNRSESEGEIAARRELRAGLVFLRWFDRVLRFLRCLALQAEQNFANELTKRQLRALGACCFAAWWHVVSILHRRSSAFRGGAAGRISQNSIMFQSTVIPDRL